MRELYTETDIFDIMPDKAAICVTTNGYVKRNGKAVMGPGIAKYVNENWHIDKRLGDLIKIYGNVPMDLGFINYKTKNLRLISFPTKNDYKDQSDINLIRRSSNLLLNLCSCLDIDNCYIPCPGCGCGGLDYQTQVKSVLNDLLDDRFIIIIKDGD